MYHTVRMIQNKSTIIIDVDGCKPNTTLYGGQLKNVNNFIYLGAMLTKK